MNSGYWNAVSGLATAVRTHEIQAHNLANVDTAGFKASRPFIEALDQALAASPGDQPHLVGAGVDLTAGPLRSTGRSLDVALEGNDLLVISTPNGERYTRDGRLTLDDQGRLVTVSGLSVQGDTGTIRVDGGDASIAADGSIVAAGIEVGRLKIVRAEDPSQLKPEGEGLWRTERPLEQVVDARVRPGFVESSNVDPIRGTTTLIEALRRFEAIEKASQLLMGDMAKSLFDTSSRPLR